MAVELRSLWVIYAGIWGALWGSFLNVVIYRLPRDLSLVRPGSRCPHCERPIRWYENVPILSFLALRGRCRGCKKTISWRYPAVEALTAVLSVLLFLQCTEGALGEQPAGSIVLTFAFLFFFVAAIIAISFIDLDLALIPDMLTIPTALLGVVFAIVRPADGAWRHFHPQVDWVSSLIGLAAGALLVLVIFLGYRAITGRVGMGAGDLTMLAMIGAFLGWRSLVFVLFLASLQGILGAVAAALRERFGGRQGGLLLRGVHRPEYWEERENGHPAKPEGAGDPPPRGGIVDAPDAGPASSADASENPTEDVSFAKTGVPFGPFLGLAALEYLFWGDALERWFFAGL